MNQKTPEPVPHRPDLPSNAGIRPSLKFTAIILVLLCVALMAVFFRKEHPSTASPEQQAAVQADAQTVAPSREDTQSKSSEHAPSDRVGTAANATGLPAPAAVPSTPFPVLPPASPETRELVAGLSRLNQLGQPMTPEQAEEWQEKRQQLMKLGRDAVPAIGEFLKQNKDVDFGPEIGKALGFASARTAMFDALQQIGGPEAVSVMTGVLGTTADPKEIALLARNLAQQDPEQYRGEVLSAVHEALTMATNKKLEGSDVGPLFEVLQKFGGAGAVADLEQATGQWKYYATMALAQLPEGAGVPALVRMAQDPNGVTKGTSDAALQMLAQMASQYPDARAALIDMARAEKITPNLWPYLTGPLAGEQFQVMDSVFDSPTNMLRGSDFKTTHVNYGNQNFVSAPSANFSPEQITQQLGLIDQLLAATSNPAAIQALQQSRALLAKRTPQTASSAPPAN